MTLLIDRSSFSKAKFGSISLIQYYLSVIYWGLVTGGLSFRRSSHSDESLLEYAGPWLEAEITSVRNIKSKSLTLERFREPFRKNESFTSWDTFLGRFNFGKLVFSV